MKSILKTLTALLIIMHFFHLTAQEHIVHEVGHLLHYGYEEGLHELDNNMVSNPLSPIHLIKRAKYLQMQGQTAEAEEDLKLARYLSPFMVDLYYDTSINGRRKLISMVPEEDLLTVNQRAALSQYASNLDKAFAKREIQPLVFWELNEAIDYVIMGDNEQALKVLDRQLEENPSSTWSLELKGIVLGNLGQFEEARAALEQAISLDPTHASAWYNMSLVDYKQGFITSAHDALQLALASDSSLSNAYFAQAMIFESDGNYEDALASYTELLMKGDAMSGEALANRGLIKKMMGNFRASLEDLNAALCIHANHAVLHKNRGNLHLLHGDFSTAIKDYDQALRLQPHYPAAQHNRAIAKLLLHDFEGGCADLRQSAAQGHQDAISKKQSFCHTLPK